MVILRFLWKSLSTAEKLGVALVVCGLALPGSSMAVLLLRVLLAMLGLAIFMYGRIVRKMC